MGNKRVVLISLLNAGKVLQIEIWARWYLEQEFWLYKFSVIYIYINDILSPVSSYKAIALNKISN